MSIPKEDFEKVVQFLTTQVEALQIGLIDTTERLEESISAEELKLVLNASRAINNNLLNEFELLEKDYEELKKERDSLDAKLTGQLNVNFQYLEELKALRAQVKQAQPKNEEKITA